MATLCQRIGYQGSPEMECFVNSCKSEETLLYRSSKVTSTMLDLLKGIPLTETNKPLAARLVYEIEPKEVPRGPSEDFLKSVIKTLRNSDTLRVDTSPNIKLFAMDMEACWLAHRAVLAMESPFFKRIIKLSSDQKIFEVYTETSLEVIRWLYLSDRERKEALHLMEPEMLPEIQRVASLFEVESLKAMTELKLASNLALTFATEDDLNKFKREKEHLRALEAPFLDLFLNFVERFGGESCQLKLLRNMLTPKGAWALIRETFEEERVAFSGLFNEFGQIARLPRGAFTPIDWNNNFNYELESLCPLPKDLYEVLELPDPWEPDKKIEETCSLIFLPGPMSLSTLETLSTNAPGKWKMTFEKLEKESVLTTHEASRWILQRRTLVKSMVGMPYSEQEHFLEPFGFRVPSLLEATALNTLMYVRSGWRLLPKVTNWNSAEERGSLTLCREGEAGYFAVGATTPEGKLQIIALDENKARKDVGVAPVWVFK